MKKFLLILAGIGSIMMAQAQEEKTLDLGLGYGLYRQGASNGNNISFSVDYRVNKHYAVQQMSQFGFMHTNIENHRANYVNQHISALFLRNILDTKHFRIQAGAGIGYTNYHVVELRHTGGTDAGDIKGSYLTVREVMQASFPATLDFSYKLSKTVSLGVKLGGYIPTHGGMFNYMFLNPQIKCAL